MDEDHEVDIHQTANCPFLLARKVALPQRFGVSPEKLGPTVRITDLVFSLLTHNTLVWPADYHSDKAFQNRIEQLPKRYESSSMRSLTGEGPTLSDSLAYNEGVHVCSENRPTPKRTLPGARRKSYMRLRRFCRRKHRTCTTLRQCNYESRGRLESCARDPIGYRGLSLNLFEYVLSDPLGLSDPFGLAPPCDSYADRGACLYCCDQAYSIDWHNRLCKGTCPPPPPPIPNPYPPIDPEVFDPVNNIEMMFEDLSEYILNDIIGLDLEYSPLVERYPDIKIGIAPTRRIPIPNLRPPSTRPVADPDKLIRMGKFDEKLYRPIDVHELGGGLYQIEKGMTRYTRALEAGKTQLECRVFPKPN